MEKLRLNIDNERYYSENFIKGWETGVEAQFKADVREQRPKGEWIDKDGWSHCSNCEKYATPHNNGCEIEPCHTPFCPWCGADMRGDTE